MIKIKIGGPAGLGIMTSGLILTKLLKRTGLYVHGYPEYPSLIRGGYNSFLVEGSEDPVTALYTKYDILIALTDVAIQREQISDDMLIIIDAENTKDIATVKGKIINLPFKNILKKLEGNDLLKNSIALGAIVKILGIDFGLLENLLRNFYPSEKLFSINLKGATEGYNTVKEEGFTVVTKNDLKDNVVMTGNEAIS
ncbi:MAG: 2-oxoacid:acceptor oxidoreductase family protein, partial [Deferribacterales bacterium]